MRTVKILLKIPPLEMLEDFRDMVNYLIERASEKQIHSAYDLRDKNRQWFDARYSQYPAHYLGSASSQAVELVKTWRMKCAEVRRRNKWLKSKKRKQQRFPRRPHQDKLAARLDQELFRLKGSILNITLRPRKEYLNVDLSKNSHKKLPEYIDSKMGEITLTDRYVCIPFKYEVEKTPSERKAGIDLNLRSVDIAYSDGRIDSVDISEVDDIKRRMSRKRQKIQSKVQHPKKKEKLQSKYRKRERNRVNDRLHKVANEIVERCKDEEISFENLKHIRRQFKGRRFNRRLNSWNFRQLIGYVEYRHNHPIRNVDPRGTSSLALCCEAPVEHPSYGASVCTECGRTYSRNRMAAAVVLSRAMRRTPLPANATALLCREARLDEVEHPRKETLANVC